MPVGAVIGGAVVGAGASIYSSSQQSKAIKSAAKSSDAAYQQVRSDAAPWRQAGTDALGRISNPNAMLSKFVESPDYQFRLNSGLEAVGQNKAVNGLLKSGSALRGMTDYAQNTASGEFGKWWDRQNDMSNTGLKATGITVDPAMTNGANQGNAAIQQGNNTAGLVGSLSEIFSKYGPQIGDGAIKNFGTGGAGQSSYVGSPGYSDLPSYA